MQMLPQPVPIGRIFLDLNNPRHVPFTTEDQAIEYLCEKEDIWPLARDIAAIGMNPLERVALLPISGQKDSYTMAEGNRRLCALMLMADPDRAPAKLRKGFEGLAKQRTIKAVPAVLFKDDEEVRPWLERIHNGAQGGRGRKSWDAEQSQRYSGSQKNKLAQAFLDYAIKEGMLTEEQRKGKITTVQRFLGVDVLQEAMGIDQSNPDELSRTRPKAEFDLIAKRFVRDLLEGKEVHSRKNRPDVIKYARPLGSIPGVTATRIEAEPLSAMGSGGGAKPARGKKAIPTKLDRVRHVEFAPEIASALKSFGNQKLESLYQSICTVELGDHTPLVCVGVWSFMESLTACAGRAEKTAFADFLSNQRLTTYGLIAHKTAIRGALTRTQDYGNTTKHHATAATFNGDQLNNDMIALKELILKVIADAASQPA